MKKGEVIFSPHFKFEDGGTSDKFLVALNEATQTTPHLLVLVTSKQRGKSLHPGCHSKEGYYVMPPNTDWFPQLSWIMFNRIYEYNCGLELKEYFEGNLKTKYRLKEANINAIINCIKQSYDITPAQLSLLK